MPVFPPDPDLTDSIKLADWLELQALILPDGNSSRGDLQAAFRSSGVFYHNEDEEMEKKSQEVFRELELRSIAAGEAYPFELPRPTLIQRKSNWFDYPAYVFCLLLSWTGETGSGHNSPSMLFEELSCTAAKRYLNGNAIRFGSPRSNLPTSFPEAVTKLCELIGEGSGYKDQPSRNSKDRKLDVVAWSDFPDRLPSKLLLFGQCAAGKILAGKLTELRPTAFWKQWIYDHPISPLINSVFIPHRVDVERDWNHITLGLDGSILFDRCRISYWAHADIDFKSRPYIDWLSSKLS
jgi:hypothetical protein